MAYGFKADSFKGEENMSDLTFGRGRLFANSSTPVAGRGSVGRTSEFCSTRVTEQTPSQLRSNPFLASPDLNDTAWQNLITHIAQEVGQTLISVQGGGRYGEGETNNAQTQSPVAGQSFTETPSLNLTGVKLVMQSEVREPPVFRGDGTDKFTVHEWEDLLDTYLRKRGIPASEHYHEILSRLLGKAKDIVKITLRSNTSLKPSENPRVIFDILKQHFSEVRFSSMPLADFYSTVSVIGENPVEYWVRLNKAVDAAEEALKRLGRQMDNPCQEAAMMFVKYCPDPSLSAVFRLKAADKWTASEVQEHLDRYQVEQKEQLAIKSKRNVTMRNVAVHRQSLVENEMMASGSPVVASEHSNLSISSSTQNDDNCMKTLITLLDRALSQNSQAEMSSPRQSQPPTRACKVCRSYEHSTLSHCRRQRLCLACFQPGHIKRNCVNSQHGSGSQITQQSQGSPTLK